MKFVRSSKGNLLTLTCFESVDLATAEQISLEILLADCSISLDLQNKFEITPSGIRIIIPCALEMRKKALSFYILNPRVTLRDRINSMGLSTLLKCISNINDLENLNEQKMNTHTDLQFLNPFIEGVIETLKLQCTTECLALAPVNENSLVKTPIDIAGVIGITGVGFNGSIAICFPEKTFLGLVSRMLDGNYGEITSDIEDAAGEILNIVFGHAKKKLNEAGHHFEKAIPTVIRGGNMKLRSMAGHIGVVLPFQTDLGDFYMEISREKDEGKRA